MLELSTVRCGGFKLYGLQLELVMRRKLGHERGSNFERRLLMGVL
jgi:hypothetical protein